MLELPLVWGNDSGAELIIDLGGSCAVNEGFSFVPEVNILLLLLVSVGAAKAGNPGKPVDIAGLFVLDGASAGVGESNRPGFSWLEDPCEASAAVGNMDNLLPSDDWALEANGPDKAGFGSPSEPNDIFGVVVIPFGAVGEGDEKKPDD